MATLIQLALPAKYGLSNIKDAIFAIKSSKEPFVVTQDDYGILIVKSTTEDGYADIVVELRY